MLIRAVSWNVEGWHTIGDEQLVLLREAQADVALLQEVTAASVQRLRDDGWTGAWT